MESYEEKLNALLDEGEKLRKRYELSKTVGPDYYDPGMMEFLDQSYFLYDTVNQEITLRFEVRGTRYEGRTERIEKVAVGDLLLVDRDSENIFNANNFSVLNEKRQNLGNLPATLCNVIAPLYDEKRLIVKSAEVSYVEPISKRSRYAKGAILYAQVVLLLVA